MVRFSCFSTPTINRQKKVDQHSVGIVHDDCQSMRQVRLIKLTSTSAKSNAVLSNKNSPSTVEQNESSYSPGDSWKSDDLNVKTLVNSKNALQAAQIKKSRSLGCILEKESGFSGDYVTEDDDIGDEFTFDYSNRWDMKDVGKSCSNTIKAEFFDLKNDGKNYRNELKENNFIKSFGFLTDTSHREPLFSVDVLKQSYRGGHNDIGEHCADHVADSGCSLVNVPTIERSRSVSNLKVDMAKSSENAKYGRSIFRRSRSFSDLKDYSGLEIELPHGEKPFDSAETIEKNIIVSGFNVRSHSTAHGKEPSSNNVQVEECLNLGRSDMLYSHDGNGDLRKLEERDLEIKNGQWESSHNNWDQLTPKEFSIRRVEHWINQIDIHGDLIIEENGENSASTSKENPQSLITLGPTKSDARSNLAMEVANSYMSSLTSTSSSAQMANLGLDAIPLISPFVGLRVLNLSGNAIVRITPGSLPKGLHLLNLSKNNISTIEGLRDLSRLRVLDLGYNRIARIGHGLASCSSLKELYLAGNKIGEVDGLHRLLKLNILDLRFNKISTAKGLEQLAANYGSLQAINLEGNPAQRNVGDEQLKRFLLGLLPNLVYYNKQAIRTGSKEVSDRTSRAAASPQPDRGIRTDHKPTRRGSMGSGGLHNMGSSHGRQSRAAGPSKQPSKHRRVRLQLPPSSPKQDNRHSDAGKKLLHLKTSDAMKRSRSTEALRSCFKLQSSE
ncbi:hypothetical protein HPP92_013649 [Vanilla planifolia]|uniref:Uncharacterized protein n=1 Tax=Vanilla planifolia TaxID=51239 RepID=A0A835V069_VANPL|nr:hypothetical protein HPP92_014086 [Vanilla planifolia]KAG0478930.1 hypothetical protein HPP92_013649 [Vanilla planifolia]